MTSLLAVYEFDHIHENIGVRLLRYFVFFKFLLSVKSQFNVYGGARMVQLGRPCPRCPLPMPPPDAPPNVPPGYVADQPSILSVSCEDCSIFSSLHVSTAFRGIMCQLVTNFPIGIRKITAALQKIAAITFLETGCLMSII